MELQQPTSSEGGAEAVLNVQPGSTISIAYHSSFGPHDDIMLLELDERLLPDILNQRVTLRGQPDEEAVLCTQSKTYALKFVGTSNSVFLIPPSDQLASSGDLETHEDKGGGKMMVSSVVKLVPGSMELTEVAPRLDNLRLLLSRNPYTFSDANEMDESENMQKRDAGLYTWGNLVERIQASDMELISGLDALHATEINGYWRMLDDDYRDAILTMLLHNLVLNGWSPDGLKEDEVVTVLEADGFPREIARHCLKIYAEKLNEGAVGSSTWRLDEKLVSIHFARRILKGGKIKIENFLEEWRRKVPEGMHPTLDMLQGEVLMEKMGTITWIYAFSVSSLPSTPAERFSLLFQERPKWEWKDLQPYIRDLKVPGLSSEGLLLKYTRRTQPTSDMEPIFSAR